MWATLALSTILTVFRCEIIRPTEDKQSKGSATSWPTTHIVPDRAHHHFLVHPKIDHQKLNNTACCQAWALAMWNRVWTFAQELRERFGVKHMLLGPPQLATLPEEQAARLNKNLTAVFPMTDGRAYPLARYPAGEEVTVQAVRECTWPSCIMVGCRSEKLPSFTGGALLEGFIAHARHGAVQYSTNATTLVQRMKQSFGLVAATVKAHPCLKLDFQVELYFFGATAVFSTSTWTVASRTNGPKQLTPLI